MMRAIVLGVILVAFALRLWGVGDLLLWGDSAYSAYTARQSLAEITWGRVGDGHPPLYYYLLHWAIGLLGQSEFTLRLPSVAFGLLTVPLAYATGRRLGGSWVALGAAGLVATSPLLIYYSRLPRMYSLAPFLALLSTYLLHQALAGRRGAWLGYFGVTLAALYTHYYAIFLVLGQVIYAIVRLRKQRHHTRPWLATQAGLIIAYGPWLFFAARTQAEVTAGIISNAPAAAGLAGFVGQIWLPFHSGATLEVTSSSLLSLIFLAAIVLGGAGWWRSRTLPSMAWLLLVSFAVAIALSYLLFLVAPYAVRPRFFVLWFPGYLVLLAWLWSHSRRLHRLVPMAAAVAMLAANSYALQDSYFVERHIQEPDSIMATQHLEELARPSDAVVFHAFWQIGYFTTHFRGQPPATYTLDQVMANPRLLEPHPRVWLSLYHIPRRDPDYPLEEWLDRNWHKAQEWEWGPSRWSLYSRPQPESPGLVGLGSFLDPQGKPLLLLEEVRMDTGPFLPGQLVRLNLSWRALADGETPLTLFLQLLDSQGHRLAGRDAEPFWGANPTLGWQKGNLYLDRPALLLPTDLPRGQYTLVAGFYPSGSDGWPRMGAMGPSARGAGALVLGSLQVEPLPPDAMAIPHRQEALLNPGLRLLGYATDLDRYTVASQREIYPTQGEPIRLTFPRRGYRPGEEAEVTLFWQAEVPLEAGYVVSVQLATNEGEVIAKDDSESRLGSFPTRFWVPGEVIVDRHRLPLPANLVPGEYTLRVAISGAPPGEFVSDGEVSSVVLRRVVLQN